MEFVSIDLTEPEPPTEAELQAYLDANMDRFRTSERHGFTQVYLREDEQERATVLMRRLAGHPPSELEPETSGDASLLPGAMQQADQAEIGRVFGKGFAEALTSAPLEQWSGPYTSPYGLHLVYVSEHLPARQPPLGEVRKAVEREWLAERARDANERFYRALRDRYTVEVAYPKVAAGDKLVAMQR